MSTEENNNGGLNVPAEINAAEDMNSGSPRAAEKRAAGNTSRGRLIGTAAAKEKLRGNGFLAIPIIAAAVFLIISIVICAVNAEDINEKRLEGFKETYGAAYEQARGNVYDNFYQNAYDYSEKKHRVSNDVLISVGEIRETAELEVLEVAACDIKEYTFDNQFSDAAGILSAFLGKEIKSEGVAWLEGRCGGVFSVDLNASEIVIDNDNHYVLIRIPSPTLEFTDAEFEVRHISNGTINDNIFNGSTRFGLEEAMRDTADLTAHLHDILNENHSYREIARSSAKTLIVNMVKGVNPDIPDLEVEVKFFS